MRLLKCVVRFFPFVIAVNIIFIVTVDWQFNFSKMVRNFAETIFLQQSIWPILPTATFPTNYLEEATKNVTWQRKTERQYLFELGNDSCTKKHARRGFQITYRDDSYVPFLEKAIDIRRASQHRSRSNLTVIYYGRLGNQMFQYAAMLALSYFHGMTPVTTTAEQIFKIFRLTAQPSSEKRPGQNWLQVMQYPLSLFDSRLVLLDATQNIELIGYFQTYKYINHMRDDILKEFRFKDDIYRKVEAVFQQAIESNTSASLLRNTTITFVGVHIRRGDMKGGNGMFVPTNRKYLDRAISYLETRFSNILFVICSDDLSWSRDNFLPTKSVRYFSEGHSNVVDLALLTKTNHTVMTIGTFGWWACYLSAGGGLKVYPKKYFDANAWGRRQTGSKEFCVIEEQLMNDTFPDDWIGV